MFVASGCEKDVRERLEQQLQQAEDGDGGVPAEGIVEMGAGPADRGPGEGSAKE